MFDCKACSQKSSWECISRNLHCCTFIIFTLSLPVNATQGSQRTGLLITRSTAKPSNIGGGGTSAQWLLGDMMRQSGARYMTTSEDEASGLMVTNPTVTEAFLLAAKSLQHRNYHKRQSADYGYHRKAGPYQEFKNNVIYVPPKRNLSREVPIV